MSEIQSRENIIKKKFEVYEYLLNDDDIDAVKFHQGMMQALNWVLMEPDGFTKD